MFKNERNVEVIVEGSVSFPIRKKVMVTVDEYEQYVNSSSEDIMDMYIHPDEIINNDPNDSELEIQLVKTPNCCHCWDNKQCENCFGSGTILDPKIKGVYCGEDKKCDLPDDQIHNHDQENHQVTCPDCKGSSNCHHC